MAISFIIHFNLKHEELKLILMVLTKDDQTNKNELFSDEEIYKTIFKIFEFRILSKRKYRTDERLD